MRHRATRTRQSPLALALGVAVAACASGATTRSSEANSTLSTPPKSMADSVVLERIHRGLSRPVGLEFFAGDERRRLFVVEQTGTIRSIENGRVAKVPTLDISSSIATSHNEQGLLGLAFHPDFKRNRRLFINYTDRKGATVIAERRAGAQEPLQVASAEKVLLRIDQPWRNHNGGYLEFGPDGLLYVGMGDGGAANDPKGAGQDAENRLGKMLRINVDGKGSADATIVQSGLRNPWRFTFDRKTGDLYIADVGQNKWEEINVVAPKDIVGANFGWSIWEGKHCFRKPGCDGKGMIAPAVEFDHETGCSVTGGIVYRGKAIPGLDGAYFYSDYCTAIVRSFRWSDGRVSDHWNWKRVLDPRFRLVEVSAFAEDHDGELYLLSTQGGIYKLKPRQP